MGTSKADVIVNSKRNNVQYHMYTNKIIVKSTGKDVYIELPKNDKIVAFYDMYYVNDCLCVIVASRGAYDIRYVLDEEEYTLIFEQLSK